MQIINLEIKPEKSQENKNTFPLNALQPGDVNKGFKPGFN